MRKVRQFITSEPKRLGAQLSDFEQNVVDETTTIRAILLPAPTPRSFSPASAVGATLLLGQLALCDTTTGSISVILSPPADGAPGYLAVVKRQAANNVTLTASGTTAFGARKINNAATKVYAAVGHYWVYFDGANWWS